MHSNKYENGVTQTMLKGAADEFENPVRSDVNNAIVPLLANSNPAKWREADRVISMIALARRRPTTEDASKVVLIVQRSIFLNAMPNNHSCASTFRAMASYTTSSSNRFTGCRRRTDRCLSVAGCPQKQ